MPAISQKTTKLLWGRAAHRCAICRDKVIEQAEPSGTDTIVGEMAHIVAETQNGPRGISPLSDAERGEYANLVLLCRKHHKLVDDNPKDYPVEILHRLKTNHELWVEDSLAGANAANDAADELYAAIIDAAVQHCGLDRWSRWASGPLNARSRWPESNIEGVQEFREITLRAPLSGARPELEAAIRRFSYAVSMAESLLDEDADEVKPGVYEVAQTHKAFQSTPQYFDELQKYRNRVTEVHEWLVDATKAGNWLCDVVRRDINPRFLLHEGRLVIEVGVVEKGGDSVGVPEYSDAEKTALLIAHTAPPTTKLRAE